MYGTASAPKHDLVRELGATPIDYRSEDFVPRILELTGDGVDYVYDPVVGATFPLERAAEAHALMDRAGTRGKVVLLCGDDRESSATVPP